MPRGEEAAVLHGLHAKMSHGGAALVGLQHVLAMFVGIITPPLLISRALDFSPNQTAYLVSMALVASGLATLVQVRRFGPLGSGLLSVQGTSLAFITPLIQAGQLGGLPLMLGMSLALSPVEMVLSRFLTRLRRILTPLVSGVVVLLIGVSLVPVGVKGVAAGLAGGAPPWAGLAVAALVVGVVVALHAVQRPWARVAAVAAALLVGYAVCVFAGYVEYRPPTWGSWVVVPIPFKYGLGFRWEFVPPFLLLYLITAIESIGDLTATAQLSGEPIQGPVYWDRIQGGVLADGFNSALAAACNSFPNTTFSQNNGVIQLTGVASRQAGFWVAGFLCLFGLFPAVSGWIAVMPEPVLGGITLLLFGFVAAAGVRILKQVELTHTNMLILATSLASGIGVQTVPEVLDPLPETLRLVLSSGITTGGLIALLLNVFLPWFDRREQGEPDGTDA